MRVLWGISIVISILSSAGYSQATEGAASYAAEYAPNYVSTYALSDTSNDTSNSSVHYRQKWHPVQAPGMPAGQRDIIAYQERGRGADYVEMHDVQVVRLLQDDNKGSRHQKWIVKLANGRTLMAVYNIDICERVPLREGDMISMGGQYIYERDGGLVHWLHEDPRKNRPHGWVQVNGVRYGRVVRSHSR